MMDYILLLVVRKMLSCSTTHGRICLGAMIGATLTCVVIVLPIPYALIKLLLFHVFVNTCMILVGLKINSIRSFLKAVILLYIGSFLLGGIMEVFRQYVKVGSLFLVIAIVGYYIVLGIWKFITCVQKWNQCHCNVKLVHGEKQYQIKALIDTGNGLCEPISGKPVSIVDRETAKKLLGEINIKDIRYVPYKSIGKSNGVLPAIQIDKMCICHETGFWIENPLIAISEEEISKGKEYEIILNPNLF